MKRLLVFPVALLAVFAGGAVGITQDVCGPFTDVSPVYCPYVLEIYYLGITAGTSPTTYSPDNPVTRAQAAVFVAKGLNQAIARSSPRAALGQWWTPQNAQSLGLTAVEAPFACAGDGADVWASSDFGGVTRVRASDGRVLETWTGSNFTKGIVVAMGRVFTVGMAGSLFMIDPTQAAGDMTLVTDELGAEVRGLTFDGSRLWTANSASVSIVTPGPTLPWAVKTVSTGFVDTKSILFDGSSIWVTEQATSRLLRLDSAGAIVQTVPTGDIPAASVFDGANIWVAGGEDVTIVRASDGAILSTLTGNGQASSFGAAFDGQRVMITNIGGTVSLWRAADLSPLGSTATGNGSAPLGACSDGVNFWVALNKAGQLARF